jgi:hypothetical protein
MPKPPNTAEMTAEIWHSPRMEVDRGFVDYLGSFEGCGPEDNRGQGRIQKKTHISVDGLVEAGQDRLGRTDRRF